MNTGQALVLGVVQGLTEFLPVSSSGHLGLAQYWFGLQEPTLFFDVFLHAASLLAIIIFFWSKIKALRLNDYWLLGIATLPAVVVGLIGETAVELVFAIPLLMGFFLIITGAINLISQQLLNKPVAQIAKLIPGKAVMIGVFQSLALIPGISRSGATLLGSFIQGLNQERAFTFTFLLAIPAILGANSLQILRLTTQQQALPTSEILLAGGLGALVASLLSLKILQKLISQAKLAIFSWYCFLLGGGVVLIQLMR